MPSSTFKQSYTYAVLLIIVGAILVSSKAIVVKLAYQEPIDSLTLLALRMLFALPLFVALGLFFNQPTDAPLTKTDWIKVAAVGISGFYAASYLDFLGLQYIAASLERLILYVYPSLVLLISAIFLKKKITKIQYFSLFVTYLGLAIVFSGKMEATGNTNPLLGATLVFFAALTYAIYLVGSGELLPKFGTRRFTAFSMIAAAIAVLAHYTVSGEYSLFGFSTRMYGLILFMSVFATFIPVLLMAEGIRIIGSNNASIISAIGPISTILMAYYILGEHLYLYQWMGAIIVIVGILLITLNK